ncbi:MAG: hypothetical protein IPM29_30075 [Planctomycetes bacterium]|nr:hypothetical protein [Planctomycetota bacterium]
MLIRIGLFVVATAALATAQQYVWARSPVNGHEYALTSPGRWDDAEQEARQAGAHLATVRNANEQAWIETTYGTGQNLWIGLNDVRVEGQFEWSSGESTTWRNWCPGEPNGGGGTDEDYVHIAAFPGWCVGDWNDAPVERSYAGLMERASRATTLVWETSRGVSARSGHDAVYDPGRQVAVYMDTVANQNQMEFANGTWRDIPAAAALPAVTGYAIAPDPVRRRVVLFGGRTGSGQYTGTWTYDGNGWGSTGVGTEPGPRTGHAMAYDEASQVIVLFGGRAPDGRLLDDTWVLDGHGWNYMLPGSAPSARELHGMAFDSFTGRVMLVGGVRGSAETWAWNGIDWEPKADLPYGGRYDAAIGKAPAGGLLVVDGVDGYGSSLWLDTLKWNGATWVSIGARDSTRRGASLVEDPATGSVAMVGGTLFNLYVPTSTFGQFVGAEVFDGLQWTRDPRSPPGPRMEGAWAVGSTGKVVVAGGAAYCANIHEWWEFDGDGWTRSSFNYPNAYGLQVVFDSLRDRWIPIGGEPDDCSPGFYWPGPGDLPTTFAGSVVHHQLAFDANRDRVMLIGGNFVRSGANPGILEWDGVSSSTWQFIQPPVQRSGTIRFMPLLRACVLQDAGGLWQWNGQAWLALGTAPGTMSHYDTTRERMVFFSGDYSRAWSWDGTTFVEDRVIGAGPDRPGYGFYHPQRRCFYVVGSASSDLWTLRADGLASHETTIPGCAGTSGVPTPRTESLPWIGEQMVVQFDNVPNGALAYVILGLSNRSLPGGITLPVDLGPLGMPGCLLANSSEDVLVAPNARWTLSIPMLPALVGAEFFDQAVILDGAANPAGAVLSAGSRGIIGTR